MTVSIYKILLLLLRLHGSSPTCYNDLQARLAKSEDNNKTYATLREFTITKPQSINDLDDFTLRYILQCTFLNFDTLNPTVGIKE
jgi:hypothetical protein